MKRRVVAPLLALASAAAIASGCGGGGDGSSDIDVGPAAAVPQDAALYLDATVKPTGAAEVNARAAAGKITGAKDPGGEIVSLIEKESKADGHPIDFQQDVEPWLGEKAGVFFTSLGDKVQHGAAVVETSDANAALAFMRKATGATPSNPDQQTYGGSSYQPNPSSRGDVFGTVGGFLVAGDLAGFKAAVDASKADSLGESSDFKQAIGDLPEGRLGTIYTIPRNLLAAVDSGQIDERSRRLLEQTAGDSLDEPLSGALTASATHIALETTGGSNGADTPQSSLIGEAPAKAWLAIGAADLGETVKRRLEQVKDSIPNYELGVLQIERATGASLEQLTDSLGDAVLYLEGTTRSTVTGALVVQTKNAELTARLLNQLQALLQLSGSVKLRPLQLSGGGSGFQIEYPSEIPAPVEVAQRGDKLVIGYGAGSVARSLTPAETLQSDPTFSAAQGQVTDLGTDLFLDFPSVFRLAESSGSTSDPDYRRARPYLDAFSFLVTGSRSNGDQGEFKAVVGLR